jgi:hypothetical protein
MLEMSTGAPADLTVCFVVSLSASANVLNLQTLISSSVISLPAQAAIGVPVVRHKHAARTSYAFRLIILCACISRFERHEFFFSRQFDRLRFADVEVSPAQVG